jgi:hypothetical protein
MWIDTYRRLFMLEENKGLGETAYPTCENGLYGHDMQAWRRAIWESMIELYFDHVVSRCLMLSMTPCLDFEALIIKQVIRVYS